MRHFLLIAGFIFTCFFAQSQSTIIIGSGPALAPDHQSGPIYRSSSTSAYDYSQYAYLYTASELASISSGSAITGLAWNKTNTGATVGAGKFKIYLKNSSVTAYTSATAFSTLIAGATLVYDNSNTNIPAATGFLDFAFSTPFTYTGGSLEIMVDWDISAVAGDPSTAAFSWQKTTETSKILGYANSIPITTSLSPTNNSIADITNTRPVIKISYGLAAPCSGTPFGGTTASSSYSICPIDSALLTVNGATTGVSGLTYQWEYSTDNFTWQDVVGYTNATMVAYQTVPMYYRRRIFCGTSNAASLPVYVGITAPNLCYCRPDSSNCSVTSQITNVHYAALNNTSGCSPNGYGNYSTAIIPIAVQAGITVPISINTYSLNSSATNYFIVWIDYDHNGVFDSSEHTFLGTVQGTGTMNGTITIPVTATIGITGMRVRAKFNSPAMTGFDACTTFQYAETEDYLVNIAPPSSCSSGLTAGIISGPADICSGFNIKLSVINATKDPTVRYAWQSSPDSLNWANINNTNTLLDSVIISQTATTWYRLVDSCATATAISNAIKVLLRSGSLNCHCTPPGSSVCTIGDLIIRVRFGTIDTTSYCSPNGYGNFVNGNQTTTVNANSYLSMSVQIGCATLAGQSVVAWIDFNQDGIFEPPEYTYIGSGCGTTVTKNISIPTNALAGLARLRVRESGDAVIGTSDACTHYANGETEDYKVTIVPYSCAVNTWTGATSNAWEDPLNWSCGEVPGVHSNVAINSGTPLISSNVTVYSLDINPAATLTVNPGFNLTITH